jgi:trigger factor
MKTEVVDVSPTRKELKLEIETDTVREAYDRVSDRYAKAAAVPGFRKGHAPRSVVRARFKNEIRSDVLHELLPQAVSDAISERSLEIVGSPDVHLDEIEASTKFGTKPISVHVHVEVLPEIALGQYKGLEMERQVRPVTEEDISRTLEGLREASASLQPVEDRGAEVGDTLTVDFHGKFVQSPEDEDIKVEEVDVILGGDGVVQEITDNLLGVRPDEERSFVVHYPSDFTSPGLAGKEVAYTAHVTAVRIKELPEVDDEWAQSLGEEVDSLATLQREVREDLEKHARFEADNRLRHALLKKLIEAHPFEVPETLVAFQSKQLLESIVRDMIGRGVDPRNGQFDWDGVRDRLKDKAVEDTRASLLLERIADAENIEATAEEIDTEIELMAAAKRETKEQVRAALTKIGGESSIADRLRNRKALDLLVDNARVRDEEWREDSYESGEPAGSLERPHLNSKDIDAEKVPDIAE